MNRTADDNEVLSSEQVRLLTAPIGEARTLPREAFVSTSFYQAEIARIYSRRWVAVLFVSDVALPGQALPFDLCGIPLVAIRGSDEKLRVFHNIVPYDGCLAVLGPAEDLAEIETPYHGWIYDLNGRLKAIPFWDGARDASLDSVRAFETDLVEVACETFLETIFINLAPEPESFEGFVGPLERQFNEIDFEQSTAALDEKGKVICLESEIAANWKTYYENACLNVLHENFVHDFYRSSKLHPRVDASGNKTFFEIIDGDLLGLGYRHSDFTETYGPVDPQAPHIGRGTSAPDKSSFSTLFPNLYIANGPDYIEVGLALPDGPGRTRDRRIYLLNKTAATDPAFGRQRKQLIEGYAAAAAEDAVICEAIQQARKSPAHSQRFYSPFWDELHYRFTQLVVRDLRQPATDRGASRGKT